MAKSDGWRTRDVREMIDRIEMEGVSRGARRCGIRSVKRGCVEGIGSCVQGEILRDMRESMRERDSWSGRELPIWRTAGGERIRGGIAGHFVALCFHFLLLFLLSHFREIC